MEKKTRNRVPRYPVLVQFWSTENLKDTLFAIAAAEGKTVSALMRDISEAAIAEYRAFRLEEGRPFTVDENRN